ncbi:PREDICTED: putative olfactory receptor 2I1 [Colobus angolensis palliatus]|uniref:putative olfactory receptor 2I1 n=1 Tax=Colobus angolensis palliatus TaxID=336983 RepID=UPI0005F40CF6|nr:PREDICTED: putative olfactory receptor 2I1 [Colobus angolensis palliatus]
MLANQTSTEERFLLLGFSDWPSLQPVLFALVLLCYLLTLTGNSVLVLLAVRDPRLHTPMYYFLCHLALVDAGFTTSVVPPLLANLRRPALWLPRSHCTAQLCASLALGSAECVLLAVMPAQRYNQARGKFVSPFYTVVTPALNPLIYTLRNKEVKGAARRLLWSLGRGQAVQ